MTSISVIRSPVWILTGPVEPSTERTMTWALPLNASSFGQQHEYHTLLTLKDKISNQYQEIVNTYKIQSSEYSRLKDTYNYLNEQVERLDDTNKDFIIILGHRIK